MMEGHTAPDRDRLSVSIVRGALSRRAIIPFGYARAGGNNNNNNRRAICLNSNLAVI